MRLFFYLLILTGFLLSAPLARAEIPPVQPKTELSEQERLSLARQFLTRVRRGFAEADRKLAQKTDTNADKAKRFPEGEEILLNIRLTRQLRITTPILAKIENGQVVMSLCDFFIAVDFPIDVDAEKGTGSGWYIREKNRFEMDLNVGAIMTERGTFHPSVDVTHQDGEIYVPMDELAGWFGFTFDLNPTVLEIGLQSPVLLPVQEKLARQKFKRNQYKVGPPILPLQEEAHKAIDVPFVDVSTRTQYGRDGDDGSAETRATAAIRTTGDLAYGTFTTQTALDKEDKLTNFRMNYKRQSLEKELLGPLKARKYELGDVTPINIPLRNNDAQSFGARVTDVHPLRKTLRPSTEITGTTFPGWEVELYREDQLLSYQVVGDDGVYRFDNVDLFTKGNNFRVVLYGPQGEIQEEQVNVPVNTDSLAEIGSAYDITITAQDVQTYRKRDLNREGQGSPNLTALYETPIGDNLVGNTGVEIFENNGDQKFVGHGGLSTTLAGTLLNLDTAVDEKGEAGAEFVARREFGKHQLRNEVEVATDKFDLRQKKNSLFDDEDDEDQEENEDFPRDVFRETLGLTGPFPLFKEVKPRYNLTLGYAERSDGEDRVIANAGLSAYMKGITVNQQLSHTSTSMRDEDELHSQTTLSGLIGKGRLRFVTDYQIKPESGIDSLRAEYRRNLKKELELALGVRHNMDPRLTEGTAQLDWDAGFANISPGLTYNTDNDLTATLNTRFGLARNPASGQVRSFDRSITGNGSVSAFVFLDKDGDGIFNGQDEPIPAALVRAPQNGGQAETGEDGYAFLTRMSAMRATDVYLDEATLGDPYRIPGFAGVSVIPREGHVTELNFPVHMAGEMDGTVFLRMPGGDALPLKGIEMQLTDMKGKLIKKFVSEIDGFYLFEKIPPGQYYLSIGGKNFGTAMARPIPKLVTIGFEGTTIYGNNVYFEQNVPDVPVNYLADRAVENVKDDSLSGRNILVRLGSYKSRLMAGLMWYKARSTVNEYLAGLDLLQAPSELNPDKNGNYTLKLVAEHEDINSLQQKCRGLNQKGYDCSIDILPPDSSGKVAAN